MTLTVMNAIISGAIDGFTVHTLLCTSIMGRFNIRCTLVIKRRYTVFATEGNFSAWVV